jgi:Periplasmic binding protein-like domain
VLRAGVAIPEELSIVGYDDSPAARTFVRLTTVKQDAENLARTALNAVVQLFRSSLLWGPVIRPSPTSHAISFLQSPTGEVGIHPQSNAGLVENVVVGTGWKLLARVRRVGGGDRQ